MILKRCYLTHHDCYTRPTYIIGKPTGVIVHDTAAGNPNLSRYVWAREDNPDMKEINADLGRKYSKNWNRSGKEGMAQKSVHGFIGLNAEGIVEGYNTLPYDICCWGVGAIPYDKYGNEVPSASSLRFDHYGPSYNYNPQAHIQFEICDDGYVSEDYFKKAMRAAQEYCAYLCRMFDFGVDKITDHQGAYQDGYGCNHSDIRKWCTKFGITDAIGWFRGEVQKILEEDEPMTTEEKKEFDKLKSEVDDLNKKLKVYRYWSELQKLGDWAYKPIRALYDAKLFAGASTSNLNLNRVKLETLVCLAAALKKQGVIDY